MQKGVSAGETVKLDAFWRRIWRQGRNYSRVVGWLLYRAFKGRTWWLAFAGGLSLLHLGSQAAAIYVVYWYGRTMEGSGVGKIPILKIELDLKNQHEWLWAIVAVSTACFVLSAVLLYFSRRQILDIVQKYYAQSLEELVLLTLRAPDPRGPIASNLLLDRGLGGLTVGCQRGVLTVASFSNAITALVGGLGGAAFLFKIDMPLTLMIITSALVAALLLYPLTLRASKSANDMEKAQTALRKEIRKLYDSIHQKATRVKSSDEVARVFLMRRRVLTELIFATEIGITVILGIVVFYMASQALAGKEQWAIFIAYIGALRMTLSGTALAVRAFASVSRFYPLIVRYYLFVTQMAKINATPLAKVRRGDTLILGTLPNGDDVVVEVGDHLALLATGQLREPMFALVGAKLAHSGEPVAAAIVDPANICESAAGLALMPFAELSKDSNKVPRLLKDALRNKVTFIVYHQPEKAGSFGEKHVLTTENGELQRFAKLGSEEGDAVLKEFLLKAVSKPGAGGGFADDEEGDDM
jgi:ABC-type multidrug transport system fused ATPase/permease subunit